MKIVEQIRSFLGAQPETPDSAVLQKAADDVRVRLTKNAAAIAALEPTLPMAVLQSIDSGATERRKISALHSERDGLRTTLTEIERQLETARQVEAAAGLADAWAYSRTLGEELQAAATAAQNTLDAAIDSLLEVLRLNEQFISSVPKRPQDWSPFLFKANLAAMIDGRFRVRSGEQIMIGHTLDHLATAQLGQVSDIAWQAREHYLIAMKGLKQPVVTEPQVFTPQPAAEESAAATPSEA